MQKDGTSMKKDTNSQKWISKRIRPYIPYLIVLVVIAALVSYISVQFALVSKNLIDTATNQATGNLMQCIVKLAILLVLQLALQIVYIRIHIKTSGKLAMSIRTDLFYTLMTKDYTSVSSIHSGEILSRLVSDVSLVSEKITEIIPDVVALFSTIVFSFTALYSLDKHFAILCLGFGPVVMIAAYIYKKRIKDLHIKCRESDGRVRSFLQESMQNFLVIKIFKKESVMCERADGLQLENFHLHVKRSTLSILSNVMFFLAMTVGYYAALAWSVYRLSLGLITFGTVTAVLGLVNQLQSPFRQIASIMPQYYMVLASAGRLLEFEQLDDEHSAPSIHQKNLECFKRIIVSNVDFSYDNVLVLDNISVSVERGEFVALCGSSGAGKSTLTKLLLAVMKPDNGTVGVELANGDVINLTSVSRKLFSYVPQGNMILSGTIRDNVTFADTHPDEQRVLRAVKLAQLDDVIEKLPDGLDSKIGEHGHGLSEGQIQRIAIARALYHDAPVLLLDEATSALDIDTENRLLTALRNLTDKTCIIISHRREVMEACDKTYILQNGTLDVLK